MASKVNNILDETLIGDQSMKVEDKPKTVVKTNNEGNDFEYQRQNFYSLVEKGQDAIEGILDLQGKVNIQEHMKLLDNL